MFIKPMLLDTSQEPEITHLKIDRGITLDSELDSEQAVENFEGVMTRIMTRSQHKIKRLSQQLPCTYVVFDILKHQNKLITGLPLTLRKDIL